MNLQKDNPRAFDAALEVLKNGGIMIMPCDTIYGIVGIAPETDSKIRAVKGRGETKPFLELIPDRQMLSELSDTVIDERLLSLWPGPLTAIVRRKSGGTVALRIPQDDFLLRLLSELRSPLFSTSVNRSGEDILWKIDDITAAFEQEVDLILSAGDLPGRLPSTIVDVTERPYRIVRHGAAEIPRDLLS